MPRIPSLANPVVGPTKEPIRTQPVQPASLAPVERGLEQLTGALLQKRQEEKQLALATSVQDAENKFREKASEALREFETAKGEQALDTSGVVSKLQEIQGEVGAKFTGNQQASTLFRLRSDASRLAFHNAAEEHSAKQREFWYTTTVNQTVENTAKVATLKYGSAGALDDEVNHALSFLLPVWVRQGGEDYAALQAGKFRESIFRVATNEYIVRGQGSAGIKFLASVLPTGETVEQALGAEGAEIRKRLAAFAGEEAGLARAISMQADPRYRVGRNLLDWDRMSNDASELFAKGEMTAEEYKTTTSALDHAREQADRRLSSTQGRLFEQAQTYFIQRNYPSFSAFMADPNTRYMRAQLTETAMLDDVEDWLNRRNANARTAPPTDQESTNFAAFMYKIATGNDEDLVKMDPGQFTNDVVKNMHPRHQDTVTRLWAGLLQSKGPDRENLKRGVASITAKLRAQGDLPMAGQLTPEQTETLNIAIGLYQAAYDRAKEEARKKGLAAPTYESNMNAVSEATSGVVIPRDFWFDRNVSLPVAVREGRQFDYAMPDPGTPEYSYYEGIVRRARQEASDKLRAAGRVEEADALLKREISRETVGQLYRAARDQARAKIVTGERYTLPLDPATATERE